MEKAWPSYMGPKGEGFGRVFRFSLRNVEVFLRSCSRLVRTSEIGGNIGMMVRVAMKVRSAQAVSSGSDPFMTQGASFVTDRAVQNGFDALVKPGS